MAQTRAQGKAFRLRFGFVMVMAGFEATPAEEIEFSQAFEQIESPPVPNRESKTVTGPQIKAWQKACDEHGKSPEEQLAYLEKFHGVRTIAELGRGQPFTDALKWVARDTTSAPPKPPAVPDQGQLPLRAATAIEMKIGNKSIEFEPKQKAYSV